MQADQGEKFLLIKLKKFCKKPGITIKYSILYFYDKNKLVKQDWRILIIIKFFLLINISLLNKF